MKNLKKKLLVLSTAGLALAGISAVNASPPDPSTGYSSVQDNVLDNANFGRCNALGILAGMVCDAEGENMSPPISGTALHKCDEVGVNLFPDLNSCMSPAQRQIYFCLANPDDPAC